MSPKLLVGWCRWCWNFPPWKGAPPSRRSPDSATAATASPQLHRSFGAWKAMASPESPPWLCRSQRAPSIRFHRAHSRTSVSDARVAPSSPRKRCRSLKSEALPKKKNARLAVRGHGEPSACRCLASLSGTSCHPWKSHVPCYAN